MKLLLTAVPPALALAAGLAATPAAAQVFNMGVPANRLVTVQREDVMRDGQWVPTREITRTVSRIAPNSAQTLHTETIVRLDDPNRAAMEERYWGRYTLLERYVGVYGTWTCISSVPAEQLRFLRIGAVVSYSSTCTNGAQSYTNQTTRRVLRRETINTAAGPYAAVVYDEELTAADGTRTVLRRWYAPALALRVRSEWTVMSAGVETRYRSELTAVRR